MLFKPTQLIPFNPQISTGFFDDFYTSQELANTTVSDRSVSPYFNTFLSGAGASAIYIASETPTTQGIIRLSTGTTALGVADIRNDINNGFLIFAGGGIILEWRVRIPVLSTAVQEFNNLIGLTGGTDAIAFLYNRLISTNWITRTQKGGVNTDLISTIPVTAGTWYKLKIIVNPFNTAVSFYINNVFVVTVTTNVPNGLFIIIMEIAKSVGIVAALADCDYCNFFQNFLASR